MRDEYIYYVYMMQSPSRRAVYIGMTGNLRKRVWPHKNHIREGFSNDYNCTRLVYWESYDDVVRAIKSRETTEALAPGKEVVADRTKKSALAGSGSRLVPGRNARSLDCA